MFRNGFLTVAVLSLCLNSAALLQAQQSAGVPAALTGENVLARLQQNYSAYLHTVPNLIADEHVVSTVSGSRAHDKKTKSDSIFRLERIVARDQTKDQATELQESHEPKSRKDREQQIDGPAMVSGVFSYAPLDFALELKPCYEYRLGQNSGLYNIPVLVVEYTSKPRLPREIKCPLNEPVSGRTILNASTMQILRIEQRLPQHSVYGGIRGVWSWSIDYAPITLEGRQIWLPRTVSSQSTAARQDIQWSFVATYSHYNLLAVHSKVLPLGSGK